MKHIKLLIVIFLAMFVFANRPVKAQDQEKLDFTVEWKNDSSSVILLKIDKGVEPFIAYIYEGSPYKDGKLLIKEENLFEKTIELKIAMRKEVFVCVYKDDTNNSCKLLKVNE